MLLFLSRSVVHVIVNVTVKIISGLPLTSLCLSVSLSLSLSLFLSVSLSIYLSLSFLNIFLIDYEQTCVSHVAGESNMTKFLAKTRGI
jgi:hypothetical protein